MEPGSNFGTHFQVVYFQIVHPRFEGVNFGAAKSVGGEVGESQRRFEIKTNYLN